MEIGMVRKVEVYSGDAAILSDYAMSGLQNGALPDARDGLKPVQRRILMQCMIWVMSRLNNKKISKNCW